MEMLHQTENNRTLTIIIVNHMAVKGKALYNCGSTYFSELFSVCLK